MKFFARTTCLFAILLFFLSSTALADPVLPGLFGDHMVLQQGREVPVWGWADAGEKITVTILDAARSTTAKSDGSWKVELPAMKAGGPFVLSIQGKKTILLKDVMVGEIWVFSGQSNMTFALSGAENAATEIPAAKYPEIRLFTVPEKSTLETQKNVSAGWEACTPDTAEDFSAVAYFFGRDLYKQLHVPIGLIHSSWPGTSAEDWVIPGSLQGNPELEPILQRWDAAPPPVKQLAFHPAEIDLEFDSFELIKPGGEAVPFSDFDNGTIVNSLHGLWTYDWSAAPGAVFDLAQPGYGGSGYAARVSGSMAANDGPMLRTSLSPGWSPADLSTFAGIRFRYRGKGQFALRTLQPSIYDFDDYSSKPMVASGEWQSTTVWFKDLRQAGWGIPEDFTPQSLSGFALEIQQPDGFQIPPSGLFDGMIAPLIPFSIRGAVWYQGESNAPHAYQYRTLLPVLIRGWRQAWGEGDFPFLVVQLPNHASRKLEPGESWWAEMREAQLMALRLPNTGLAVTIDVGEADNVHPHKKAEVGQRLALWALGTTYKRDIVYSGPLYASQAIEGGRIRIRFTHTGGGLEARGGALRGFAVAGADKVFHWADAAIDGDSVIVSSAAVPAPVAVRYAWADNPDCNLYNKEGLPASPFRTDGWPVSTVDDK